MSPTPAIIIVLASHPIDLRTHKIVFILIKTINEKKKPTKSLKIYLIQREAKRTGCRYLHNS